MITYKIVDEETKKWTATITSNYTSYKNEKKDFVFTISGDNLAEATEIVSADLKEGNNKIMAEISVTNPWVWKTSGELRELNKKENTIYKLTVSQ